MELRDFKKAAIRLFYDMINADGIIEDNEIWLLEGFSDMHKDDPRWNNSAFAAQFPNEAYILFKTGGLKKKYNIKPDDIYAANRITTTEAIDILKYWQQHEEKKPEYAGSKYATQHVLTDLETISGCDNDRDLAEAKLLTAVQLCLNPDINAVPIKLRERKLRFSKKEILYIETEYTPELHAEIKAEKNLLEHTPAIYGYDFVYLPDVIDFLSDKARKGLLKSILMFSKPAFFSGGNDTEHFAESIQQVTTAQFTSDFARAAALSKELPPSLLFKLKNTTVTETNKDGNPVQIRYADFIAVPIKETVAHTLHTALHLTLSCAGEVTSLVRRRSEDKLYCKGIHKTIIDYTVDRSDIVRKVIIHTWGKQKGISFEGISERIRKMPPKQISIYLMLCVLAVKNPISPGLPLYLNNHDKKTIEHLYTKIYEAVRGEKNEDEWDTALATHLSAIKRIIHETECLPDKHLYAPEKVNGIYCLRFNPATVELRTESNRNILIPLKQWMESIGL